MVFGRHVNKFYLRYWYFFLLGIAALLAVDYFQLEIPVIYGSVIKALKNKENIIESGALKTFIYGFIKCAVIVFIGRFAWRNTIFGAAVRIEADMREDMFIHSEKLSQSFYKKNKTGALMAYFTNDLQAIRECFGFGTVVLIDALFLGVLTFYKMLRLNYKLALLALVPLLVVSVLSIIIGTFMERKFSERQKAYEKLSDFTQESFSGINVVKAYVKEPLEIKEFERINTENRRINVSFARFQTLVNILLNVFISTVVVIIYLSGSFTVLDNVLSESFDVGDLTTFVQYFGTLIWPMMAVGELINMSAQGRASYKRIAKLLDERVEIKDKDIENVESIDGSIEFKNLSFKYPDGNLNVLEDVSFSIESGTRVGIIGKTGCGKTTIVDLLLRIYNVEKGHIFIDGKDIMSISFKKVRGAIGYVPQDNFLFSDTIEHNIAFAFDEGEEDEIIKAATLADVHQNIIDFDKQYQTVLGERGVTLSGGQKQRVSIARALIKNPPILILDDSVSAVDTKTEEKILSNLSELRQGKTTILIAHRISTVKDLDKIILLNDGKVEAVGTHDELMLKSNMYRDMVRLQSLEEEIEGGEING